MKQLKDWLHNFVKQMTPEKIASITANHHCKDAFYASLIIKFL